ncbi:MAG: hypothetical protein GX562_01840, partial [Coriobacteriaceae bacterium]|nr:hypothetical protein [Coriobacteriaceae bacterium]
MIPHFASLIASKTVNQAIARFAIVSDPHVGWGNRNSSFSSVPTQKTISAFDALATLVPDLDALLIVGDLNNLNDERERAEWSDVILPAFAQSFSYREMLPSIQLSMGNHDFWWYSQQRFEAYYGGLFERILLPLGYPVFGDDLGQRQNTCSIIAGVSVIKLCGEEEDYEKLVANAATHHYTWQYDFLKTALSEAEQRDPSLPIIVMSHHGLPDLRMSKDTSGDYGRGTQQDMIVLMREYPQVIFVSGHVHNPMTHPAVITQDHGFTCLFSGTLGSYLSDEFETPRRALLKREGAQSNGMILDVFPDGSVSVYKLDFSERRLIDSPVRFNPKKASEGHLSTIRQRLYSQPPLFPKDAVITQVKRDQVSFTQAIGKADTAADTGSFAYYYRIKVADPDTGLSRRNRDTIIRSDYYRIARNDHLALTGYGGSSKDYIITPYNAYDVPGRPLFGDPCPSVVSFSGANRQETSVMVSMSAFEDSESVIISSGYNFSDTLAASSLAGLKNSPLLLHGQTGLADCCIKEIIRLGAKQAILVGDTLAKDTRIVNDLRIAGIDSSRVRFLAGEDRIATAQAIYSGNQGWGTTAIIVNCFDLTLAGSVSPLAFKLKAPILYTDDTGMIPAETIQLIRSGRFQRLLIIGKTNPLRPNWDEGLTDFDPSCEVIRIQGKDRYDASLLTMRWAIANDILTAKTIGIATARSFPDAITGGILQGLTGSVLVQCDPGFQENLISGLKSYITKLEQIRYFGGANSLSARFRSRLKH